MSYDAEKIANMSGEKGYKKAPEYKLNELRIDGNRGSFFLYKLLEEKGEDGKIKKETLEGDSIDVIFLKHRRKLAQFKKNEPTLQTNEHSHKDDMVMLFGANKKGKASELREIYQGLRTQQIVYAFVPSLKQIVRVVIKGASLGSEAKPKEVKGYYDYLGSFNKDEHSWQYLTNLKAFKESGQLGDYFAIEFIRGEKLTDERIEKVAEMIEEVHNKIKDIDAYYDHKTEQQIVTEKVAETGAYDGVEYPDDDISPEDIPF